MPVTGPVRCTRAAPMFHVKHHAVTLPREEAGDRRKNNGLARSQITRVPIRWLPTLENGP